MPDDLALIRFPELVVGIAGPIGVDIETICATTQEALRAVDYGSTIIKITDEIDELPSSFKKPRGKNFHGLMKFKMDHASDLCRTRDDPAFLMRVAIAAIRRERDSLAENGKSLSEVFKNEVAGDESFGPPNPFAFDLIGATDRVAQSEAYIIRQLKRPEEVTLLRRVYGRQFILISAYGSETDRREVLEEKIRRTTPLNTSENTITYKAQELIDKDADEGGDVCGQHLRDTFHLADVFIDGINKNEMSITLTRFFNALFGLNSITPSKKEYGMYCAKSASLRSSDLSRQVGAAIFSKDGEIIVQGCNEVPKANGGTYWDCEQPDFRDISLGSDPNEDEKREVVRDVLERLERAEILKLPAQAKRDLDSLIDHLTSNKKDQNDKSMGALKGSKILDLTEYGRVVHAEMCAICDAARLGKSLKGGILYCTTFPCHNCAKHILASGIKSVVFMEPYPKSKAKILHKNEIEVDGYSSDRISFVPFLGISPYRYRDIFEKREKRKSGSLAKKWYYDVPCPMIDVLAPSYTELERHVVRPIASDAVQGILPLETDPEE
ncbi:anti-phage dCTP deaminase [Sphingorhabdus sp.]|jgi:deoxycytidylate deaminase|uniref:anti-phage dCTP deaminase n=1 Tax=Sphingorhabdus sp. TaxID=1902408 RepID=UPI002CCEC8F8|nr:anti-phage dCTP deaminase [Sphingorhabdus sp.]HMT41902.1 anti-phage dCTP deaminase [Sphingorhabdus sp.]